MKLHQFISLNRSTKTLIFAFIFFCLSNFHHLRVVLELTSIHLTLIPILFFTDIIDIVVVTHAFLQSKNKNMGAIFGLVLFYIRMGLGLFAGVLLNYFAMTSIGLMAPTLFVVTLCLTILCAASSLALHAYANKTLKDPALAATIKSEGLVTASFCLLLVLVSILFFAQSIPLIYAASLVGTLFMVGASIFACFEIFDKPAPQVPHHFERHQSRDLPSYYRVLKSMNTNDIKDNPSLCRAIDSKLAELEQSAKRCYSFERSKISQKQHLLQDIRTIIVSEEAPEEKVAQLERASMHYPEAYQSFFQHTSDTEALYRLAVDLNSSEAVLAQR